jgi:hypothetical protein
MAPTEKGTVCGSTSMLEKDGQDNRIGGMNRINYKRVATGRQGSFRFSSRQSGNIP